MKLYEKNLYYQKGITFFEQFSKQQQDLFFTAQAKFYYIKLLLKDNQFSKSLNFAIFLLKDKNIPTYIKRNIHFDLFYLFSSGYYQSLDVDLIGEIILFLNERDQKSIILKKRLFHSKFKNETAYINLLKLVINHFPNSNYFFKLANKNSVLHKQAPITISKISNRLLSKGEDKLAYKILNSYKGKPSAVIYFSYANYYQKRNKRKKYFKNLVLSLSIFPYKISYHDELIKALNEISSYNKIYYWQYAVYKIPNTAIKGRLVYWYLQYLKKNQKSKLLEKELKKYYLYMPGSYYIREIYKEFQDDLTNPKTIEIKDMNSLIYYLSATGGIPKIASKLKSYNLEKIHFPQIYTLETKVKKAKQKVQFDRFLHSSLDYLKIGQVKHALNFLNWYSAKKNLSQNEKELILIALGEYSKNYYLSVYYTRSQIKKWFIPDDVLLLPTKLATRLYPRPHRKIVISDSRKYDVSENIIYAIMRQESFFRENAVSRSNAKGLMQIMGPTGREIVNNLKFSPYYSLYDPEISIKLGSIYLNNMLRRYDNNLQWASIAYNGGPGNLRKWKKKYYKGDFNAFLEILPSQEARSYCRIISSNFYNYQNLQKFHRK